MILTCSVLGGRRISRGMPPGFVDALVVQPLRSQKLVSDNTGRLVRTHPHESFRVVLGPFGRRRALSPSPLHHSFRYVSSCYERPRRLSGHSSMPSVCCVFVASGRVFAASMFRIKLGLRSWAVCNSSCGVCGQELFVNSLCSLSRFHLKRG